ncbi:hypothetical protein [Streptomyces sp. R08]|uniref:Uncharacterized protein n=1 Tax=Streptomyces sp. R08 TaxID=3238624 RepID=A0AB39MCZ3_9ACTN
MVVGALASGVGLRGWCGWWRVVAGGGGELDPRRRAVAGESDPRRRVVAEELDPRRWAARARSGSAATSDAGRSSVPCRSVCSGQLRRLMGHDLRSADASGSAAATAATERQLLPDAADRMVSNADACSAMSTAGSDSARRERKAS